MGGIMSTLEKDPREQSCGAQPAAETVTELLEPRKVWLGKTTQVRRLLPHKERRMVGAWCFVDHYGPDDVRELPGQHRGMWVPPHPHTSLQTVSWLFDGEVLHRDSVGSEALVRPGELNIMTAGPGIAHSEESPGVRAPILHGAQLWVALPDDARDTVEPSFDQYADLPRLDLDGVRGTVMLGEVAGVVSPATTYTPLVGADLSIDPAGTVPLTTTFEYAVLVVDGPVRVEQQSADRGEMVYLGQGRESFGLSGPGRVLLLGGEPFAEEIVMWWNFIGRSHDEIVAARNEWMAGLSGGSTDRFGVVHGFDGDPLPAPEMPHTQLKPRGRTR
jgi:redox-sensitive bicupin YhaK (pirin superfamily)